jgi:hypothetical protein
MPKMVTITSIYIHNHYLQAVKFKVAMRRVMGLVKSVLIHPGNGLGYKYNYDIQHGHHGHAYGSSYPNGYGGFGVSAAGNVGRFAGGF